MTAVDALAFGAVVIIGLTLFARAEVMSPRVRSSYVSNIGVRAGMDLVVLASVFLAYAIWGGLRVPPVVAGFLGAVAVCSVMILVSMRVHDGRDTVRTRVVETRREDAAEVRAAVEETVPVAIEAAIPQVLKDLGRAADPYEPH